MLGAFGFEYTSLACLGQTGYFIGKFSLSRSNLVQSYTTWLNMHLVHHTLDTSEAGDII